jgi:hypothetical protein
MINTNDELDPQIANLFDTLKEIPERDPTSVTTRRQEFQAEATRMGQSKPAASFRSLLAVRNIFTFLFQRKSQLSVLRAACMLGVVMVLVLGSGGFTVAAAQSSLPDEALYPVKTFSEDMLLFIANDSDSGFDLEMQYYQRRLGEILAMEKKGKKPPAAIGDRLNNLFIKTIAHVTKENNLKSDVQLKEFRAELLKSAGELSQSDIAGSNDLVLSTLREQIINQLGWVEVGIMDPQALKDLLKNTHVNSRVPVVGKQVTAAPVQTLEVIVPTPGKKETETAAPCVKKHESDPSKKMGDDQSGCEESTPVFQETEEFDPESKNLTPSSEVNREENHSTEIAPKSTHEPAVHENTPEKVDKEEEEPEHDNDHPKPKNHED